ncbi:hypothetical protein M9H77_11924 [Catharanthus roseus]|uniref:Uncharacterized protein n=1 Tax=Catharanthus roseus TaxID=4058 RepID=A0ACC0BFZ9_CATRO|nr:hypothetical protein M9H77_11924 [Catharanthus roseus]
MPPLRDSFFPFGVFVRVPLAGWTTLDLAPQALNKSYIFQPYNLLLGKGVGMILARERKVFLDSAALRMMHSDMEYQIHVLEQEAYGAVLRAFKAQSDALTWEKEGLITELRKELRVSDDEHRELLTKVNADGLIHRIREWRKAGGSLGTTIMPQTGHDQLHSPTVSASRKKQKTTHSVPFGTASQALHPQSIPATTQPLSAKRAPLGIGGRRFQPVQQVLSSPPTMPYQQPNQGTGALVINELSQRTCESLVGRKVMTRFSDDSNFCEAIITDYDPVEGRHALIYDINTPNESLEWVDLKQVFLFVFVTKSCVLVPSQVSTWK